MARSRVEIILVVGILVLGTGWILLTVATATTGWIVFDGSAFIAYDNGYKDASIGLFQLCTGAGDCLELKATPNLEAVQAMCIIAILLSAFAGMLAIFFLLWAFLGRENSKLIPIISFGLCLLTGLCILIGIIVFAADYFTVENFGLGFIYLTVGYSFGLCIAGGCLIFIGGIFIMMGGLRSLRFQNQMGAHVPPPQMAYNPQAPGGVSYVHQPGGANYGQQPGGVVYGQQQGGVNYGQQPGGVVYGQQQGGVNYGQQLGGVVYGQQQGGVNYGQQPGGVVHGQQPGGFHGQQSMEASRGQNPNGFHYGQEKGEIGATTSSVS